MGRGLSRARKAATKVTPLGALVSFHSARFTEWNLSDKSQAPTQVNTQHTELGGGR